LILPASAAAARTTKVTNQRDSGPGSPRPALGNANNGGPTQTLALLPASPAIDAGSDMACPPIDQRGISRSQGPHCDIGAFERNR
jgi:hypothetical protein